jgi:hypothetical protein
MVANGRAGGPGLQRPPTSVNLTEKGILVIPEAMGTVLPSADHTTGEMGTAGRIAPLLALTGDLRSGSLLTSDHNGLLRCYSASLQLLGERQLPGVAYQLVLDSSRGHLYAAVAPRGYIMLGPLGDRERADGDLHVYDVKDLLEGRADPGVPLKPIRTVPVRGHMYSLLLSRDGQHLYYLSHVGRKSQIGRLALRDWTSATPHEVLGAGLSWLVQAPDSGQIIAMAGGELLVIDSTNWTKTERRVEAAIAAFAMGSQGQLYAIQRGTANFLVALDLNSGQIHSRMTLPLVGRFYTRLSPDGGRLYISTSAVLDGRVFAVDVTGKPGTMRVVGHAGRDRSRLLRGGLFVSPDGKLVMTGNGVVFHAPGVG